MNVRALNARMRNPFTVAYNRGFYHAFEANGFKGIANKREFVKDKFRPSYDAGYKDGERYRKNLEADAASGAFASVAA